MKINLGSTSMSVGACLLCGQNEPDINRLGETFYLTDGSTVHHFCLLFSSKLAQNGRDDEGAEGFLHSDIIKEVERCCTVRCCYCDLPGASAVCSSGKCKLAYHVNCLLDNGGLLQFFGFFKSFCRQHRVYQCLEDDVRNSTCGICMDDTEIVSHDRYLCSPCCRNLFHKTCLQRMAYNFGYFFACPGCRNNDESKGFVKEMKQHGIFVPQRDASWELAPGAYQELLSRHDQCDAEYCLCPFGRRHSSSHMDSPWCLLTCKLCGSSGTHVSCQLDSSLSGPSSKWTCELCASVNHRPVTSRRVKLFPDVYVDRHFALVNNDEDGCSSDNNSTLDRTIWFCDVLRRVCRPQTLLKFTVNHLTGLTIVTRPAAGTCPPSRLEAGLPVRFTLHQLLPSVVLSQEDRLSADHAALERSMTVSDQFNVCSSDLSDRSPSHIKHDQLVICSDRPVDHSRIETDYVEDHQSCSVKGSEATARPSDTSGESSVDVLLLDSESEAASPASLDDPLASPSSLLMCERPGKEEAVSEDVGGEDGLAGEDGDPMVIICDSRTIDAEAFQAETGLDTIPCDPPIKQECVYITDDLCPDVEQDFAWDNASSQLSTHPDPCTNLPHRTNPQTAVRTSSDPEYSQIKAALAGFQCPVCSLSCLSLSAVTQHYYTHAEARNEPPLLVCSRCEGGFMSIDQFLEASTHSCCDCAPEMRRLLVQRVEAAQRRVAWRMCRARGVAASEERVAQLLQEREPRATERPVSVVKPFSINADEVAQEPSILPAGSSGSAEPGTHTVPLGAHRKRLKQTAAPQKRFGRPSRKRRRVSGTFETEASSDGFVSTDTEPCGGDRATRSSETADADLSVSLPISVESSSAPRQNRRSATSVVTYNEATLSKINVFGSSAYLSPGRQADDSGSLRSSRRTERQLVQSLVARYRHSRRCQTARRSPSRQLSSAAAPCVRLRCKSPPSTVTSHQILDLSYLLVEYNRWDCPTCDCFYLDQSMLASHVVEQHFTKKCRRTECLVHATVARSDDIVVHRRFYHKSEPLEWTVCGRCLSARFTWLRHECGPRGQRDCACPVSGCLVACGDTLLLNDHLIVCHSLAIRGPAGVRQSPYHCPFCAAPVKYHGWYAHMNMAHNELFRGVGRALKEASAVDDNEGTVSEKPTPFPCPFCDMFFVEFDEYQCHMESVHLLDEPSPGCSVAFCCWKNDQKSQQVFKLHMLLCHKAASGRTKCQFCDLTFDNISTLRKHERDHSKPAKSDDSKSCSICGKANVKNLNQHRAFCHSKALRGVPGDPNVRYICPKCPDHTQFFFNDLVVHLTDSHGIALKKSGIHAFHPSLRLSSSGGKNAREKSELGMRRSTGELRLPACGADDSEQKHSPVDQSTEQSDAGRFSCLFCSMHFQTIEKVTAHERKSHPVIYRKMERCARAHIEENRYVCKRCSGEYKRKRRFIRHYVAHHAKYTALAQGMSEEIPEGDEKPIKSEASPSKIHVNRKRKYMCPVCPNRNLRTQQRLRVHIRSKHKYFSESSLLFSRESDSSMTCHSGVVARAKSERVNPDPDDQAAEPSSAASELDCEQRVSPAASDRTISAAEQSVSASTRTIPVADTITTISADTSPAPCLFEVFDISDSEECDDPLAM